MSRGADKCGLPLDRLSKMLPMVGKRLLPKSAMMAALDYFASSTMAKCSGCSGRNSIVVSNGFPLE
jgi:hypothetical protein